MTKKEKTKKLILIIFLLLVCSALVFVYQKQNNKHDIPAEHSIPAQSAQNSGTAFLEINGVKYENEIPESMSVYDFMTKFKDEGKITFKDTTYTGMGKFIEEINGVKNSGNKNWIYYVNNKKAEIGVSNYKINPGDVASWKYESNAY